MTRLLLSLLLSLAAGFVGAQDALLERTELIADEMEMTSTLTESRVICIGNVKLTGTNVMLVCDRLEVIAARTGDKTATFGKLETFKRLLATGNVRMVQGDREAMCGQAEVLPLEQKIILTQDPVVIDHSSDFIQRGDQITLFRGERRLHVKNPRLSAPPIQDLGADAKDPAKDN